MNSQFEMDHFMASRLADIHPFSQDSSESKSQRRYIRLGTRKKGAEYLKKEKPTMLLIQWLHLTKSLAVLHH